MLVLEQQELKIRSRRWLPKFACFLFQRSNLGPRLYYKILRSGKNLSKLLGKRLLHSTSQLNSVMRLEPTTWLWLGPLLYAMIFLTLGVLKIFLSSMSQSLAIDGIVDISLIRTIVSMQWLISASSSTGFSPLKLMWVRRWDHVIYH